MDQETNRVKLKKKNLAMSSGSRRVAGRLKHPFVVLSILWTDSKSLYIAHMWIRLTISCRITFKIRSFLYKRKLYRNYYFKDTAFISRKVLLIRNEKIFESDLRTRRRFQELDLERTASYKFYYYVIISNINMIEQRAK